MKTIYLDSSMYHKPAEIHKYLQEELGFPKYYGGNLAALYDCMTDICEQTVIRCYTGQYKNEEMERYFLKILMVLKDSAEENDQLIVEEL